MILVIEDNPRLLKNIQEYLELEHFVVEGVRDGAIGLEKARDKKYKLILLDLNLPMLDGMDICKILRLEGILTPVFMLTARADMEQKIQGLNAGADDYLTKPFDFSELVARIRALLRRETTQKSESFLLNDIVVNFSDHTVTRSNIDISLSPKEFRILEFLIRNQGKVKSRTEILESIWGEAEESILFSSDTVEVHMSYLRKKLGKDVIKTVRGVGYIIST